MAPMTQSGTKEFTSCKRAPATRTQVRSSRTEKPGKRPIWIALLADSEEERKLEARGRIELPIKVLQTFALPLGYRAIGCGISSLENCLPREAPDCPRIVPE